MRPAGVACLFAGLLGLGSGSGSGVAADDPPPLQPPATAPSGRADSPVLALDTASPKVDVRRDGPPTEMPEDRIGPAPGPDYFLIPGQYVPAGEGVSWRPGFWAKSQPGWEWVPARWDRRADGWAYREGHWERTVRPADAPPTPGPSGPFSPNAPPAGRDPAPDVATDLQPLPDVGLTPMPDRGPAVPPGQNPQVGPGPNPVPMPNPVPAPVPNPDLIPPPGFPGPPFNLPVTDIFLPNGMHIQVVPGRLPRITTNPLLYPRVRLPQVMVRPLFP